LPPAARSGRIAQARASVQNIRWTSRINSRMRARRCWTPGLCSRASPGSMHAQSHLGDPGIANVVEREAEQRARPLSSSASLCSATRTRHGCI
jgi:hypothetical protein